MSHTKEPWKRYHWGNDQVTINTMDDDKIAECFEHFKPNDHAANARRIVACVNACKDLETESLESMVKDGDTLYETLMEGASLVNKGLKVAESLQAKLTEAIEALELAVLITESHPRWKEIGETLEELKR